MAEDDKMAGEPKAHEPSGSEPAAATSRPASLWTASDGRGPLEKAETSEEPNSEKLLKVHNAEGGSVPEEAALRSEEHDTSGLADEPATPEAADHAMPGPITETPPHHHEAQPTIADEDGAFAGSSSAPQKRSGSLWPVAAGLVAGAVIGAGSAYFAYGFMDQGAAPQVSKAQVDALAGRIDALEKHPDPQAADAKMEASIAALSSKVATLQDSVGTAATAKDAESNPSSQSTRGTSAPQADAASAPAPAPVSPAAPPVDLGPINEKIAALQSNLDALKAQGADTKALQNDTKTLQGDTKALQDKVSGLEGAVAGVKTTSAAAQASVATVEGEQKTLAGRVMIPALAVAADSLVQQIDRGQPFAAQVDALASLGADSTKIAILRQYADKGVPSSKTLAAKLEPLAEPLVAIAHKPPPNAGIMDRLKSGMFSMVSVHRADDPAGDDLPSRVARIKADLTHDDVSGAVATWASLPPDAKAKSADWGALAKTSAEARTTARSLQSDAIAALGSKKS